MRRLLAATVLAAVTGCSGTSSDESGTSASCSDVWQDGKTLPANYEGCKLPDGSLQVATFHDCGGRKLNTYGNAWAFAGGEIHQVTGEVAADPAYRLAFNNC